MASKLSMKGDLADGIMTFSLDLYKGLGQENQNNLFFSPFSVTIALATMSIGASGQTAVELKNTLGLGTNQDPKSINNLFFNIISSLNIEKADGHTSKQFCLHLANRIFVDGSFSVEDNYKADLIKYYESDITSLDFKGDTEEARKTVNNWVEEVTNNKIKDIMTEDSISTDLRLLLVNAIYFKGEWADKFPKWCTKEDDFNVNNSHKVKVHLMCHPFALYEAAASEQMDCQMIEFDYLNKRFAMYVILPNKIDGLANLEKQLTIESFKGLRSSLSMKRFVVFLPKFQLDFRADIDEQLKELGIRQAFSSGANFSNISPDEQLYISNVTHKAFINVNEDGTEASAATKYPNLSLCEPSQFRADHPFMFVIYDKLEDMILFIGRVIEPPPPSEPLVDMEAEFANISPTNEPQISNLLYRPGIERRSVRKRCFLM